MFRYCVLPVLMLGVAGFATAGQIQIGGTNGLTSSYITTNCPIANCLNSPAADGAFQSSPTAFSEVNYQSVLFSGAATGPSSSTLSDTSNAALSVAGAGGVQFNLINDANNPTGNAWSGGAGHGASIDVPIDQLGVTSVWTMLNDENGMAGIKDAWATFDFASSPDATTGLTSVTIKLVASPNTGSGGVLQNTLLCSSDCPANNYSDGANGSTLISSNSQTTLEVNGAGLTSNSPSSTITGQVTVYTNNLYTSAFSGTGPGGSSGTAVLDDQGFVFSGALASLAASDYLVDMRVYDNDSSQNSDIALSAITVESATPEPSTVLLLLTGIGAMTLARYRNRRA